MTETSSISPANSTPAASADSKRAPADSAAEKSSPAKTAAAETAAVETAAVETAAVDKCRSYHHGNLRNALIVAAAELIEESGSVDFAMVEAARRAGVSSAAPYRHFRDKDDLLQSVAQLCFMGLSQTARDAIADRDVGSEDAVIALGGNYIRFMLDHQPFIDLMWGDHGARAMDDESVDLKGSGFYVLVNCVAALCDREKIQPVDPVEIATQLWSMVHGLSALAMNEQINRFLPDADVFDLLEKSTCTFFAGLRQECLGGS
jgi:AcrR family transcriptional regulator